MANILNKSEQQYLLVSTGPSDWIRRTNVLNAVVDILVCCCLLLPQVVAAVAAVVLFKLARSHSNTDDSASALSPVFLAHFPLATLAGRLKWCSSGSSSLIDFRSPIWVWCWLPSMSNTQSVTVWEDLFGVDFLTVDVVFLISPPVSVPKNGNIHFHKIWLLLKNETNFIFYLSFKTL